MKTLTSKFLAIALAAGGLLTVAASQANAEVVVVRENVYEHPHYWHADHVVRYEDRVVYHEPVYIAPPVVYHEHIYRECPVVPVYSGCYHYAR